MQSPMCARLTAGLLLVSALVTPTFAANAGSDDFAISAQTVAQSSILGRLADGTQSEAVSAMAGGTWYESIYGENHDFVSADHMTLNLPASESTVAPAPAAKVYAKIDSPYLNVRAGADDTYEKVDSILYGHVVEVLGEENGWYKVKDGYISAKYTVPATVVDFNAPPPEPPAPKEEPVKEEAVKEKPAKKKSPAKKQPSKKNPSKGSASVSSAVSGSEVVAYAKTLLGSPYVYGGKSPSGFDCSGFTSYVYGHFGISLNRSSGGQTANGAPVSRSELKAGDLLFFSEGGRISHVGIYVGGNKMIHASTSRTGVIISSLSEPFYANTYTCARRVIK